MWVEEARVIKDPETVVTTPSAAGGEVFGAVRKTEWVRLPCSWLPSRAGRS
jgi:hypothetical protein